MPKFFLHPALAAASTVIDIISVCLLVSHQHESVTILILFHDPNISLGTNIICFERPRKQAWSKSDIIGFNTLNCY